MTEEVNKSKTVVCEDKFEEPSYRVIVRKRLLVFYLLLLGRREKRRGSEVRTN